jgi:hypothetical protein
VSKLPITQEKKMSDPRRYYSEQQLSEIAYKEFVSEVRYHVREFQHIVNDKLKTMQFNEKNVDLLINCVLDIKDIAKNFEPSFGGGYVYDFTDDVWDEIENNLSN